MDRQGRDRARHRSQAPRPRRAAVFVLWRRLPFRPGGGQPAKDGLPQRLVRRWRLARAERPAPGGIAGRVRLGGRRLRLAPRLAAVPAENGLPQRLVRRWRLARAERPAPSGIAGRVRLGGRRLRLAPRLAAVPAKNGLPQRLVRRWWLARAERPAPGGTVGGASARTIASGAAVTRSAPPRSPVPPRRRAGTHGRFRRRRA